MAKIQTAVQEGLRKEVGQVTVDCGSGVFKAAKPGEIIECKLVKRSSQSETKPEAKPEAKPDLKSVINRKANAQANPLDKIQVTIAPSGDVSWQRIIQGQVAQSPALPNSAPGTVQTASATGSPKAEPSAVSLPAPPAGRSAEEFLNQPGAANDFE